jgi:hypothetical protein
MVKKHLIRLGVILILSLSIFATLALLPVSEGDSGEAEQLQEGVVRFHVIAKSDETVDQELKLDVRDAVLDYLRPSLEGVQEAEQELQLNDGKIAEGIRGIKDTTNRFVNKARQLHNKMQGEEPEKTITEIPNAKVEKPDPPKDSI